MSKPRIVIHVSGGNIQHVDYPEDCGVELQIRDYDNGEEARKDRDLTGYQLDENGDAYQSQEYGYEDHVD